MPRGKSAPDRKLSVKKSTSLTRAEDLRLAQASLARSVSEAWILRQALIMFLALPSGRGEMPAAMSAGQDVLAARNEFEFPNEAAIAQ